MLYSSPNGTRRGAHLPFPAGHWVCDVRPVRRQTYVPSPPSLTHNHHLPSQWPVPIYTAWWTETHCVWTTWSKSNNSIQRECYRLIESLRWLIGGRSLIDFNGRLTSMARNSLLCADVPLRNYSLTRSTTTTSWLKALLYTECKAAYAAETPLIDRIDVSTGSCRVTPLACAVEKNRSKLVSLFSSRWWLSQAIILWRVLVQEAVKSERHNFQHASYRTSLDKSSLARFPLAELTARVNGPSWWVTGSRVHGSAFPLAELTRPINSASGNARPSTRARVDG